ncbi:hypothetical protein QTP88_027732 [Uroleucon formosanum]
MISYPKLTRKKSSRYVLFNFCLGVIRNENKQNNRAVENNFNIDTCINEQLENLNEDDQLIYTSNKCDIVEFVVSETVQKTGSLDSGSNNDDVIGNNNMVPFAFENSNEYMSNDNNNDSAESFSNIENQNDFTESTETLKFGSGCNVIVDNSEVNTGLENADESNVLVVRTRKKRSNPKNWSYNLNKKNKLKLNGKEYYGKKKTNVLKFVCNCKLSSKNSKLKCKEVKEEEWLKIFEEFWKLSKNEKQLYIKNYTKKSDDRVRVCKVLFLNTLGIGKKVCLKMFSHKDSYNSISDDINNNFNTTEDALNTSNNQRSTKATVSEKKKSHYCRANTSKLYLEPNWTSKTELYNFYCNDYSIEKQNIGLFQPKKNACDICTAFDIGNLSQEKKEKHDSMKKEARMEKEKDKMSENEIFTMDLQFVLLCPKSNVSSLYYKTKLIVHNFTIYDLKRKNEFCFLWNEIEGGLSSNEFSSIMIYFLQKYVINSNIGNMNSIILYSDGCTYQNRNTTLSNALLNLSINSNVTIIQKFLQCGHTQMEVDSMHSTIGRKVRNRKINSFFSLNFCKSIQPGNKKGDPVVTNLKAIKYEPDRQIKYKLKFTEEDWSTLKLKIHCS